MQMTRSIGCVGIGAGDDIISTAAEIQGARPDVADHAESRQFSVMHSMALAMASPVTAQIPAKQESSRAVPVA